MPNRACNYRSSPLSMTSVFRFEFFSEAPGLLGAVTKVFGKTERSRLLMVRSLAVLSLGVMAPAARTQAVINFPRRLTGAAGHITLENPLAGGSIHLNLSHCGWTF
jgi:hypothetical protein